MNEARASFWSHALADVEGHIFRRPHETSTGRHQPTLPSIISSFEEEIEVASNWFVFLGLVCLEIRPCLEWITSERDWHFSATERKLREANNERTISLGGKIIPIDVKMLCRSTMVFLLILTCLKLNGIFSFTSYSHASHPFVTKISPTVLHVSRREADNKREIDDDEDEFDYCCYTPASWEAELNYMLNQKRLEDAWMDARKRSKPRYLSYRSCSEWAKHQNMWKNKEEWMEWIGMGEGKPSLVPSDPESYYVKQGTWISWKDFLQVAW